MRAAHHAKKGPPNITNNIFMCGEAYRLYMSGGRFHQIHLKVSCYCKMRCIKIEMKLYLVISNYKELYRKASKISQRPYYLAMYIFSIQLFSSRCILSITRKYDFRHAF